ncbi:hypothetical protein QTI33_14335 [Variovorax sp. J22P271]|uniref:hypothetical protein n=1 Tax=Variovorax davisae TaxID=3053515 RepID=UPI002575A74F|nr:hypothetical protein [Variovorax sp. J22P271]MDM0033309.1 hypothetical protein [Variovorax sp. J22P271]
MNAETPGRGSRVEIIAASLLAGAGMIFFVLRGTDWFSAVPGDLGDARFNSVILEHLWQWATQDVRSLWTPRFFYPTSGTLAFSDSHFGSGVVYVLARLAGLEREHAFNAWLTVGCALNFTAMHFVMRRLEFSCFPAAVAAFIFAFSLPAMAQDGHAQLTYRFAIPLAYLSFTQLVRERRIARLAQLAAWGTLQFYCSIYLGVFLVYLLATTGLAMLLTGMRPKRVANHGPAGRIEVAWALAAIAVCGAATGALLLKYNAVSQSYGFKRPVEEVLSMLPRPQSYLYADRSELYSWLGRIAADVPMRHEQQMFFGFSALLLTLLALVPILMWRHSPRRQLVLQSFTSLVLLFVLTLYVGEQSIYKLFLSLPGVSSIRAVSRVVLVMALPLALMAASGVENLLRWFDRKWLAYGLIILAFSIETASYQFARTPITDWQSRSRAISTLAADKSFGQDSILYVSGRFDEPMALTDLDAMLFAQDKKIPTLNGYSGNSPPGVRESAPCISKMLRIYSLPLTVLAARGLTHDSLMARTVWVPKEQCNREKFAATDASASPPTEEQAQNIHLSASASDRGDHLDVILRIRNNNATTLHTLSRTGHPLSLSWRFVSEHAASDPSVGWNRRHELSLSIPPGAEEAVAIVVDKPTTPGTYDLQFSVVAENHAWLHLLKMPLAHLPVAIGAPAPSPR